MKCHRREIPMPSPETLAALVAAHAPACWLDSALTGHPHANFSFLVLQPLEDRVIRDSAELPQRLQELDRRLRAYPKFDAEGLPFCGGVVGFLSYPTNQRDPALPLAHFLICDTGIAIDHRRGRAWVFSLGLESGASHPELAERRCEAVARMVGAAVPVEARAFRVEALRAELSRETYLAKVKEIQKRIQRGDCYQVNFSQRFFAAGTWDAAELYLRLRAAGPAPQMAFFNLGKTQILSASPETLLEVTGRRARSFPIKGTRPRSDDGLEDRRLASALLASPKDAAELLMIVDLVRNDLGRCCETGSIRVPQLKALDTLPQVHHLYAEVEGTLRPGVGPLEALALLSPGGSITGAPKVKAMEVIRELEASTRGIYTGSIGYAGFDGRAAFNIAIRTAFLAGNRLTYAAGGGIVADSVPEAEYEECLHKARAFFEALGSRPEPG